MKTTEFERLLAKFKFQRRMFETQVNKTTGPGFTKGMSVSAMSDDQYIELNRQLREGEISYRDFLATYTSYPSLDLQPHGSPYDPSITKSRQHSFSGRGYHG